jgi:hypothetical protein
VARYTVNFTITFATYIYMPGFPLYTMRVSNCIPCACILVREFPASENTIMTTLYEIRNGGGKTICNEHHERELRSSVSLRAE